MRARLTETLWSHGLQPNTSMHMLRFSFTFLRHVRLISHLTVTNTPVTRLLTPVHIAVCPVFTLPVIWSHSVSRHSRSQPRNRPFLQFAQIKVDAAAEDEFSWLLSHSEHSMNVFKLNKYKCVYIYKKNRTRLSVVLTTLRPEPPPSVYIFLLRSQSTLLFLWKEYEIFIRDSCGESTISWC